MKKTIQVVAAIIENDHNEILCALRSTSMSIPNKWELPGGKIEQGEDAALAIQREIQEELDCDVKYIESFHETLHEYDSFIVNLIAVKCKLISGTPKYKEHSSLLWLKRENLDSLVWAPADIPAVKKLIGEKV